jgi:hypothetical protein
MAGWTVRHGLGGTTGLLLMGVSALAGPPQAQGGSEKRPAFEVVSVKPNNSGGPIRVA